MKRLPDGTLTYDSPEEAREHEREMNLKAGTGAGAFILVVIVGYFSSEIFDFIASLF